MKIREGKYRAQLSPAQSNSKSVGWANRKQNKLEASLSWAWHSSVPACLSYFPAAAYVHIDCRPENLVHSIGHIMLCSIICPPQHPSPGLGSKNWKNALFCYQCFRRISLRSAERRSPSTSTTGNTPSPPSRSLLAMGSSRYAVVMLLIN